MPGPTCVGPAPSARESRSVPSNTAVVCRARARGERAVLVNDAHFPLAELDDVEVTLHRRARLCQQLVHARMLELRDARVVQLDRDGRERLHDPAHAGLENAGEAALPPQNRPLGLRDSQTRSHDPSPFIGPRTQKPRSACRPGFWAGPGRHAGPSSCRGRLTARVCTLRIGTQSRAGAQDVAENVCHGYRV